jgi:hypothetical protein
MFLVACPTQAGVFRAINLINKQTSFVRFHNHKKIPVLAETGILVIGAHFGGHHLS